MNNREKGRLGESIAINYLSKNGAKILEINYTVKIGEIDIIAKIGNELVFIEVKSRSNLKYGYPAESVNYKKIKKITSVANCYLLSNNLYNVPTRFDILEVYLRESKINHMVSAF